MNDMTHSSKVLALGVGSAGSHIIRTLKLLYPETGISTAVIDTDSSVLENHPADAILAASSDWNLRTGTGCGGDIIRGERALVRERQKIIELLHGYDLIIVTAGLGGGTATGGLRTIASVIRAMGTPSIFLPTLPFSTENFARRKNAESCLSDLICQPNVVMPVPTWAFAKPDVQPLHGWTRPEYFARMLSELSPILTPVQLERVRAAYS